MKNIIERHIFAKFRRKYIRFINIQGVESGSDIDIYCVVSDSIKSKVIIFKENGIWIEIFIDNWSDMKRKIINYDEICVGLITSLKNYWGEDYLKQAKKIIPERFRIPLQRKNIFYYRIKVLFSKYKSVLSLHEKNYFKNLIFQQLFMLAFDYSGRWPESPKKWFSQIKLINNSYTNKLISSFDKEEVFIKICKEEAQKFKGIKMIKESKNNQFTFIV
jgi:hypothetical protein